MTPKELRERAYAQQAETLKAAGVSFNCNKKSPPVVHSKDSRRTALAVVQNVLPCIHLGPAMRDQKCGCQSKLRKCAIFEKCTTGDPKPGIACCRGCEEFRTRESFDDVRRHLIYFVYPVTGNGVWQKNLNELKTRSDLFNGRRIVAICSASPRKSHKLDHPNMVVEYLGKDFETIQVSQKGAKRLGEVTAFPRLLQLVSPYTTPNDYTFYGHAKGVLSSQRMPATLRWGEMMYGACLDRWDRVEEALRTSEITGAFRHVGGLFPWHFSGTFYWFKNASCFARNWKNVPQRYGGTEMWPAMVWSYEETSCVFGHGVNFGQLYGGDDAVYQEYLQWVHSQS